MRFARTILFAASTLALGGCASYAQVQQQRVDAIPEAARAYVAGTYVVSCVPRDAICIQAFNSISLFYRSIAKPHFDGMLTSMPFNMYRGATTYDILDQARRETGFYFCDTVPAGRMEIFSYSFYNFAGGGSGFSLPDEKHFSVQFDAKAGEVVDIGRLKVTTATGENLFGMDMHVPGVLLLSDLAAEDQQRALAKCPPAAQGLAVTQAHLRAIDANRHPLVRDETR